MATSTGYYIYGFTNCNEYYEKKINAVGGQQFVQNIPYRDIGILYTPVNGKAIQPTRDNLVAHQQILESTIKKDTIIPMRFGVVAQSKGSLFSGLNSFLPIIRSKLSYFNGKLEFTLKAFWIKEFIYDRIVNSYPSVKNLKDSANKLSKQAAYYKSIDLGQMVERALLSESEKESEKICNETKNICIQQIKNKKMINLQFLNLSMLINNNLESKLDELVTKINEERKNKVLFKYIGPSPPSSFIDLHLKI